MYGSESALSAVVAAATKNVLLYMAVVIPASIATLFMSDQFQSVVVLGVVGGCLRWASARSSVYEGVLFVVGGILTVYAFHGVHIISIFHIDGFVDPDALGRVDNVILAFGGPGVVGWIWDVVKGLMSMRTETER